MKTYRVELEKSYIVTIKTDNEENARDCVEYFTSNSIDLSTEKDRKEHNFEIVEIECTVNETYEVEEINEVEEIDE